MSRNHPVPRLVTVLVFARDRGIVVLWLALLLGFTVWCRPYFASLDNALLIANAAAITSIYAVGVGIGIISGTLDLSIPGTAALGGVLCGWLLVNGVPTPIALLVGLVSGGLVGLVNGLISLQGFNPIIVTIGSLSVLSGVAAVIAGGYTIPGLTQLAFIGTDRYLGVPAPVFIAAALGVLGTAFLTRTRHGIRLMAVGGNAEAARRAGLASNRYKVLGFVISGLSGALGGLITTALVSEASPASSPVIVFDALTAVALAGVALSGGRGSIPRVLVGALILATISNGLLIKGIQPYWATIITGLLLLASLSLERYVGRSVSGRLIAAEMSVHGADPGRQP